MTHALPLERSAPPRSTAAPRPSLARLTAVELRKCVDTRAGRWFLALVAFLAAASLGYAFTPTYRAATSFEAFFNRPVTVVTLLLPVLGVLTTTSEWTRRTALTTYTLVPRRGRVLAAELAALLVVSTPPLVLTAGASAASVLVAGAVTGDPADWAGAARLVAGAVAGSALSMVMGAAVGALLQQTATALVTLLVGPTLVFVAVAALFKTDGTRWVDVNTALDHVSRLDLTGSVAQTLTALALWIALPLAAGAVRTLRREVS